MAPPTGSGVTDDRPSVAAIVAIVALLLLLAGGGWWLMSGSSDDDEEMVTATLPPTTDAPDASTTTVDDALVAQGFAAIMAGAINASGSSVGAECVQTVATRPEHADLVRDVMSGETDTDEAMSSALMNQIIEECIGIGVFAADVFEEALGVSRPSADCIGRTIEADSAMKEAFLATEEVELTPEMRAAFTLCLTPAELEMLAAAG